MSGRHSPKRTSSSKVENVDAREQGVHERRDCFIVCGYEDDQLALVLGSC
jgi:hypothetical protein